MKKVEILPNKIETSPAMIAQENPESAKKKHIPVRMCIACRERFPKKTLQRMIWNDSHSNNGSTVEEKKECRVKFAERIKSSSEAAETSKPALLHCIVCQDPEQRLQGRGFYLCGKEACRKKFDSPKFIQSMSRQRRVVLDKMGAQQTKGVLSE